MKTLNLFWFWFCSQMEKSALNAVVESICWFVKVRFGYTAANIAAATVLFCSIGLALIGVVICAAMVAIAAGIVATAIAPFAANIAVLVAILYSITR